MSRVYVVLVNWNGWQDTIECLESLLCLDYPNYRVVVCDNGSSDDSPEQIISWAAAHDVGCAEYRQVEVEAGGGQGDAPFLTLIRNDANLGFAGGNNVGMRYALARGDADYCWLLNNDTVVDTAALKAMVTRLVEKPDAGMCGSTLRYYDDRSRVQALGGAIYYDWLGVAWHIGRMQRGEVLPDPASVEKKMDYIVGASLLVRTVFVKKIGYLAEDYFLFFEEMDWAQRGKNFYTLAYAPRSIVYHKIGRSVGTRSNPAFKSVTCDYYTFRNRIVYSRRYCKSRLPFVYAVIFLEGVVRGMVGRWDLARVAFNVLKEGFRS